MVTGSPAKVSWSPVVTPTVTYMRISPTASLTLQLDNGLHTSLSGASRRRQRQADMVGGGDGAVSVDGSSGSVNAGLSFADSSLAGLKLGVTGFKIALGETGLDLTGVNGQIAFLPALGFDVGVTVQEEEQVAGEPVLKLDGNVNGLQLATGCKQGTNPFEFLLAGNSPPLESAPQLAHSPSGYNPTTQLGEMAPQRACWSLPRPREHG